MTEKKKIYPNPKFSSIEEEDKYWATHSPLGEGFNVEAQKEKQKRSSFLSIRLTGEELTQLRDIATANGMGPSTFIRILIKDALSDKQDVISTRDEGSRLVRLLALKLMQEGKANGITIVKENAAEQYKAFEDAFCIIKLSDLPSIRAKLYQFFVNEMYPDLLKELLVTESIKIIAPGVANFKEMTGIAKEDLTDTRK